MRWNVPEFQRNVLKQVGVTVPPDARVLDLGCGNGADAEWFAERARETFGIDLVADERWSQIQRQGLQLAVGDGEALSFPDRMFDIVFMKDVLHHARSPRNVLLEARRVCASGGTVYVIEGNRFNPLLYVHMTLMLGHQHFRRPIFRSLVRGAFPEARFIHFEAHVYPVTNRVGLAVLHALERAVAATPLVQRLASYNAAVAVRLE